MYYVCSQQALPINQHVLYIQSHALPINQHVLYIQSQALPINQDVLCIQSTCTAYAINRHF